MQLFISDIAQSCNVAVNTVRNWCKDYGQFLSAGASVPAGKRTFTTHDLQVISYIAQLRAEGMQRESIVQRLSETSFPEIDSQPVAPTDVLTDDQMTITDDRVTAVSATYSTSMDAMIQSAIDAKLARFEAKITDIEKQSRGLVLGIGIGFVAALLLVILLLLLFLLRNYL